MGEYIVQMQGITKRFPGVLALNNVQLNLRPGLVHSLMGENGAGKSTLMKILAGVYTLDEGQILLNDKPVKMLNPRDGLANGISMIHQELMFIPELTAAENIYLGRELRDKFGRVSKKLMIQKTREVFDRWNINIDPSEQMKSLSVAQAQMVEIAKAIAFDSKIIIMDEPTSSLTPAETDALFKIIRSLKAAGKGVVYISHRLEELEKITDRITVLRDGEYVKTLKTTETDIPEVISLMVGRKVAQDQRPENRKIGSEIVLIPIFDGTSALL